MMESLAGLTVVFVLVSSFWCWVRAGYRWAHGKRILECAPREEVPWGLLDLILAMGALMGGQLLTAQWIAGQFDLEAPVKFDELDPNAAAALLLGGALSTLGALVFSVALVVTRNGASLRDLGVVACRLGEDVRIGIVGFLMLAPIVYGIQLVLVQWFKSAHPLIEFFKANPRPEFFALCGFSAVIVAPLAEEYFFRVLLQGWLQRLPGFKHDPIPILMGGTVTTGSEPPCADAEQPAAEAEAKHASAQTALNAASDEQTVANGHKNEAPLWPILLSSFLFAMAHYSHGPDPVPLFVLALGLGYLYQRTNRILPCIVVHVLLNATSLFVLWLIVYGGLDSGQS